MRKILILILLALIVGFVAGAMYYRKWGSRQITIRAMPGILKPVVVVKKGDNILWKDVDNKDLTVTFHGSQTPCVGLKPKERTTGCQVAGNARQNVTINPAYECPNGDCADPEIAVEPDGGGGKILLLGEVGSSGRAAAGSNSITIWCDTTGAKPVPTADLTSPNVYIGFPVTFGPDSYNPPGDWTVTIPPTSQDQPICAEHDKNNNTTLSGSALPSTTKTCSVLPGLPAFDAPYTLSIAACGTDPAHLTLPLKSPTPISQ